MYRIFCESYENFIKTFEGENDARLKIAEPLKLIVNLDSLKKEKESQSEIYKKLSDLVFYMQKNMVLMQINVEFCDEKSKKKEKNY